MNGARNINVVGTGANTVCVGIGRVDAHVLQPIVSAQIHSMNFRCNEGRSRSRATVKCKTYSQRLMPVTMSTFMDVGFCG